MADVITRLKLESGEYDSKIKRAVTGLQRMEDECRKVGGTLAILEKDQKQFVQSLGSMQTVSQTTRGKIGELSSAFIELRSQYNRLTDEEKKGNFGKALSASLDQLKTRVQDAKQELKDIQKELDGGSNTGGGWLSGLGGKMSGMMQVFGGNLLTKATMEVANLGAEMVDTVKQGIELARQGEGIRNAFARLGRGDILDGLRQATHGTVTDLELMKAAVKFNDFRLPVEELGTMLAFAQQKAKDTGQSVDYMVDSIVTGLGRKSLMILDNLGLSASEIRERMKETGDMTTAVGAIIREQMAKAGDYVETAADRAAQANVSLQNKMEELGRKFAPVEEASTQLWTSMKIAILDVVSGPLARLLNGLTEAGRLRNQMNEMAGGNSDSETEKQIKFLRNTSAGNRRARYDKQIAIYNTQEQNEWRSINALKAQREAFRREVMKRGVRESDQDTYDDFDRQIATHTNRARSWQMFRINYQQRAQGLLNPNKPLPPSSDTTTVIPTKTGKGGKTNIIEETFPEGSMKDLQRDMQELKKVQDLVTSPDEWQKYQQQIDAVTEKMNTLRGVAQKAPEMATGVSGLNQKAISTYQSMLQESMKGMEYGSTDLTQTLANSIDVTTLSNLLTTTMQQGIDMTAIQLADGTTSADLWESILNAEDIPDKVWEELSAKISEELKKKGKKGIKVDTQTGGVSSAGEEKNAMQQLTAMNTMVNSLGSIAAGVQNLGIKVPEGISQSIAVLQTIMGIVGAIQTISTTKFLFSTGGIVHAAGGVMVPGTSFSGDRVPALLNSGELVLNKAQQGVLAAELEDGNRAGGVPMIPFVTGDKIILGANNFLKGAGKGELVTTSYLRQKGLI